MTTIQKIVAALAVAAVAVVGGTALTIALRDAGVMQGLTCAEWNAFLEVAQQDDRQERFFLAVKSTVGLPPAAIENRIIGDCSDGECIIKADGCSGEYRWKYKLGPLVNLGAPGSWRIIEAWTLPYVAGGLKAWASGHATTIKWLESFKEAISKCLDVTTASNCRALFDADSPTRCWLLTDGYTCQSGKMYGPGLGGSVPCNYSKIKSPMPCVTFRGSGSEVREAERVWTDDDLK